MTFKNSIEAMEEIDSIAEKYNLKAADIFVLQILKSVEIQGITYDSMLEDIIKKNYKEVTNK